MEDIIRAGVEENLEVREVPRKGRGIFSRLGFERNEYVCEYAGELITCKEGEAREARYRLDEEIGSYIYFFRYSEKRFCIDATEEWKTWAVNMCAELVCKCFFLTPIFNTLFTVGEC